MNRRILTAFGIAGVLVLAGAATDASAACNPTKDFKLAFSEEGDYFINCPAGADCTIGGPNLKGRFWQAGARGTANEGATCPEATYLVQIAADQITIFGQSGGDILGTGPCDNVGCVAGAQVTLLNTISLDGTKAYYAVGKVNETVGEFRHNRGGTDWAMTEVPRPRVTNSSRGGNTVTVNLSFDAPTGAHGEADGFSRSSILSGYQVVRCEALVDCGRLPGAWTPLGAVIPVSEGGATLGGLGAVCGGTTQDVFLAMRPVFDSGQFSGDYVGASTRIECDPAVADPRFKMIDRNKTGGTIRSNPR